MDVSQPPVQHVWIGMPRQPSSVFQEIVYETLPAFCSKCSTQGHNIGTCKLLVKDIGKKEGLGSCMEAAEAQRTRADVGLWHRGHIEVDGQQQGRGGDYDWG
ncbi:hypothetical protein SLA2020_263640 [Shorea laevis]